MLKIVKESEVKSINPERLPRSLRRYAYMIEDFEKDDQNFGFENCYWCYLIDKPEYETSDGTITIHDTISFIRSELKDIEQRNKSKTESKKLTEGQIYELPHDEEVPKTREDEMRCLVKSVVREKVGELENILMDYDESDSVYVETQETLDNHQGLVDLIYKDVLDAEGIQVGFGSVVSTKKHVRFLTKDAIIKMIESELSDWGY